MLHTTVRTATSKRARTRKVSKKKRRKARTTSTPGTRGCICLVFVVLFYRRLRNIGGLFIENHHFKVKSSFPLSSFWCEKFSHTHTLHLTYQHLDVCVHKHCNHIMYLVVNVTKLSDRNFKKLCYRVSLFLTFQWLYLCECRPRSSCSSGHNHRQSYLVEDLFDSLRRPSQYDRPVPSLKRVTHVLHHVVMWNVCHNCYYTNARVVNVQSHVSSLIKLPKQI